MIITDDGSLVNTLPTWYCKECDTQFLSIAARAGHACVPVVPLPPLPPRTGNPRWSAQAGVLEPLKAGPAEVIAADAMTDAVFIRHLAARHRGQLEMGVSGGGHWLTQHRIRHARIHAAGEQGTSAHVHDVEAS
jgi:hypothetical protein